MGNLEHLLTPDQIVSDSIFLRVNRGGLGIYRQPININHTQYQVLDPSLPIKFTDYGDDADVIFIAVSLTSYYKFSRNDETV